MRFREHRGLLLDSLSTTVVLQPTRVAIANHLTAVWGWPIKPEALSVEFYSGDSRPLAWPRTFIVKLRSGDRLDVVGFTDSTLDEPSSPQT